MSKITVTKLETPYVSVDGSYGGNQGWFKDMEKQRKGKTIEGYGCGLIGASDILLHLMGTPARVMEKKRLRGVRGQVTKKDDYSRYIEYMEKHFFHILPKLGISGILLAWNLNLYFFINRKKLRKITGAYYFARWAVWPTKILDRMKEMLSNDLPVILAIGPGMFRKNKLTLYNRIDDHSGMTIYKPVTKTKDHYVTVTGITEYPDAEHKVMLEISSWGNKYYVNYHDYIDYVKRNDNFYFSNILYIKKKSLKQR